MFYPMILLCLTSFKGVIPPPPLPSPPLAVGAQEGENGTQIGDPAHATPGSIKERRVDNPAGFSDCSSFSILVFIVKKRVNDRGGGYF